MAMYYCGETGCKGHHSFAANCSGSLSIVPDYPALLPFIQGLVEEETQPVQPVQDDTQPEKARGQSIPSIKAYNNKLSASLTPTRMSKHG